MARPKDQTARREELTDAAVAALVERGPRRLRFRDIADRVGLTTPAVSYYFSDLNQLIFEAYQRVSARYLEARRVAVAEIDTPAAKLARLTADGIPARSDDHDTLLTYQMSGDPATSTTYGALSAQLFAGEVELYRSVIDTGEALGDWKPVTECISIARALVAMEDGLGLRVALGDASVSRDQAITDLRAAAAAMLGIKASAIGD